MRVAIYCRVSTQDQDNKNQLAQLRKYCAGHGHTIIQEYSDTCSGGKADRQQFKRMFEHASQKKFDLLLFWSLDRLSREGVLATLQYLQTLTQYGISYKSFTEQYLDSLGPFREAVLAILAAIARQEKIRISERTKAGLEKARKQGRVGGRRKALCPANVDKAAALRAKGETWPSIAKLFQCHSETVRLAVKESTRHTRLITN